MTANPDPRIGGRLPALGPGPRNCNITVIATESPSCGCFETYKIRNTVPIGSVPDPDILRRIRILGCALWVTDPDLDPALALFVGGFKNANKK
jgi:hypothetical protein